jgi:hypothetical protein
MGSDPAKQELAKAERNGLGLDPRGDGWKLDETSVAPVPAASSGLFEQLFQAVQRTLPYGLGASDPYGPSSNCRVPRTRAERIEAFVYGRSPCYSEDQFWRDLEASMSLDKVGEVAVDRASWAWEHRIEISLAFLGIVKAARMLERAAKKNPNASAVASLLAAFGMVAPPLGVLKKVNEWLRAAHDAEGDPVKIEFAQRKYAEAVIAAGLAGASFVTILKALPGKTNVAEQTRPLVEINPTGTLAPQTLAASGRSVAKLGSPKANAVARVVGAGSLVLEALTEGASDAVVADVLAKYPIAGSSQQLDVAAAKELERCFFEFGQESKTLAELFVQLRQILRLRLRIETIPFYLELHGAGRLRELLFADGLLKGISASEPVRNIVQSYLNHKINESEYNAFLNFAMDDSFANPQKEIVSRNEAVSSPRTARNPPAAITIDDGTRALTSYFKEYFIPHAAHESNETLVEKIQTLLLHLGVSFSIREELAEVTDMALLRRLCEVPDFLQYAVSPVDTHRFQLHLLISSLRLEKISTNLYRAWVEQIGKISDLPMVTHCDHLADRVNGDSRLLQGWLGSSRVVIELQNKPENDPRPQGADMVRVYDVTVNAMRAAKIVTEAGQ